MKRESYIAEIDLQFKVHSVCAILGPRQIGKTTLAKMYAKEKPNVHYFDLENPEDLSKLENPMLLFSPLENALIVIDEIQRRPELFPTLRVLVDEEEKNRKFLILGSASRDLIKQSSETLAGRIGYLELFPFSFSETHDKETLLIRGGFPRSFLANSNQESLLWRRSYISTFLERDIPNLGFKIPPEQLRRFWLMLSHYHGQIFNASEIGKSLGISDHTVRKYLDILAGTFMIRILQPWFENIKKRQVKSPKIYFRDSGILNSLIGINNYSDFLSHPKLGSFWEGFALEEVIREAQSSTEDCYFWATQSGAELDLLLLKDGKRLGFECKYSERPKLTPSMKIACEDLKLDHLYVVFPDKNIFPLSEQVTACGFESLPKLFSKT